MHQWRNYSLSLPMIIVWPSAVEQSSTAEGGFSVSLEIHSIFYGIRSPRTVIPRCPSPILFLSRRYFPTILLLEKDGLTPLFPLVIMDSPNYMVLQYRISLCSDSHKLLHSVFFIWDRTWYSYFSLLSNNDSL